MDTTDHEIDRANATFWNELCGTQLASACQIEGRSAEALVRFDQAYLSFYPYLLDYVQPSQVAGQFVLEVGLGYGTLGQQLAGAGALYHGLDLAEGPIEMMSYRLRAIGAKPRVFRGSGYALPFDANRFDYVVSIGCFHHTGRLQECIDEVHRVLKPSGSSVVMLYNNFSYRQWLTSPVRTLAAFARDLASSPADSRANERQRRLYDANSSGAAAPETVFVSVRRARELFRAYSSVDVHKENCGDLLPGGSRLGLRQLFLGPLGRRAGLDLYVVARK
jgi:SAM-dependent methyltransferase